MKIEFDDGKVIEITDEEENKFKGLALKATSEAMLLAKIQLTEESIANLASLVFYKLVEIGDGKGVVFEKDINEIRDYLVLEIRKGSK